ncbi:hypothetical protein BDN67DRAFT_974577 [Paxillus ammoniavirescens]|nr:hypothetical protein BDN67DRAFT_974577 [Paxillus ammoniavirescens]
MSRRVLDGLGLQCNDQVIDHSRRSSLALLEFDPNRLDDQLRQQSMYPMHPHAQSQRVVHTQPRHILYNDNGSCAYSARSTLLTGLTMMRGINPSGQARDRCANSTATTFCPLTTTQQPLTQPQDDLRTPKRFICLRDLLAGAQPRDDMSARNVRRCG